MESPHKERQTMIKFWVEEIETYMSERDYQRDFFENLKEQFYKGRVLTEKQYAALERIYERTTA